MSGPYFEDLEKVLDTYESQGKSDRGVVTVETRATNQHGEPVLTLGIAWVSTDSRRDDSRH